MPPATTPATASDYRRPRPSDTALACGCGRVRPAVASALMSRAGAVESTPRTTATFLFTDIESHTPLWEAHPDVMAHALATHDALIRDTVVAAGGRVVKYGGDGVMAVFGDAAAAVAAAYVAPARAGRGRVAGSRHFAGAHGTAHWGGVRARRRLLRFGGDPGRAPVRRRARPAGRRGRARLRHSHRHTNGSISANTACAGSTAKNACTSSRRRHCGRSSRRCALRSRGAIACRSLGRRSSVAAGSWTQSPSNWTRTGSSRSRESEAVGRRDSPSRRRVRRTRLSPTAPNFVDLSTVTDEEATYPAVAAAFGLQTPPGIAEAVDRRIYGYLANRRTLVVIDNCEHLLDAVAELVDAIMQNCEDVRVLGDEPRTTTRRGRSASSRSVPSMSPRTRSRCSTIGPPDMRVTTPRSGASANGSTAYRWRSSSAAARTSHLSLEDIAERLDDRFRLLTGGRRRVQRQQTLQAALDWSHDLLTPDERKLLRSLAVFNGPIRLDALEGICGRDHADVIGVLGSLVERSMVSHDPGERRYRLLETVRLYAEQKLVEAGEADEYRRLASRLVLGARAFTATR